MPFSDYRDEKQAEIIPIEPDAGNAVAGRYGKTSELEAAPWLLIVEPLKLSK